MKHFFTRYRLIIIVIFILVAQGAGEWYAFQKNHGNFSYALDDSYIMMAISKNLALHGVWGATKYEFSATATSPIFTILLALVYKIFGVTIYAPLVVNLIIASTLVWYADRLILKNGISEGISKYILFLFIFLTPFFALLAGSMEHLLHLLSFLMLLFTAADYISALKSDNRLFYQLLGIGFVAVGIRYESLFLAAFIGAWLIWQKQVGKAILFLLFSSLPVVLYGIYSISQGGYLLPNSILLKGVYVNFLKNTPNEGPFIQILKKFLLAPWLISLLIIGYTVWVSYCKSKFSRNDKENFLVLAILGSTVAHFLFGWVGHVFRYEAYLIGSATIVFSMVFVKNEGIRLLKDLAYKVTKSEDYFSLLLIAIMLYFPFSRVFFSYVGAFKGKTNIYEQQVQMGKFLNEHYAQQCIGASDIGAVTYYADIKLIDFYGLASIEIAKAKLKGKYSLSFLDSMARAKSMKMAVFFDQGMDKKSLNWYLVRRWFIQDNIVCGDDNVAFYAPSYPLAQELDKKLMAFEPSLPQRVLIKKYDYSKTIADQ